MHVEGTQHERKVQHYRTQKERRVRMEKHYGRRWNAAGTQEGTQMERRVQTHQITKTLRSEMERGRNAGLIHAI